MTDLEKFLFKAIKDNNLEHAKILFSQDEKMIQSGIIAESMLNSETISNHWTFLARAASLGQRDFIELFVEKWGKDAIHVPGEIYLYGKQTYKKYFPVHIAMLNDQREVAIQLMLLGATPLTFFVKSGVDYTVSLYFKEQIKLKPNMESLLKAHKELSKAQKLLKTNPMTEKSLSSAQRKFSKAFSADSDYVFKYLETYIRELNANQNGSTLDSCITPQMNIEGFLTFINTIASLITAQKTNNLSEAENNEQTFTHALSQLMALDLKKPTWPADDEKQEAEWLFPSKQDGERRQFLGKFMDINKEFQTLQGFSNSNREHKRSKSVPGNMNFFNQVKLNEEKVIVLEENPSDENNNNNSLDSKADSIPVYDRRDKAFKGT